MEIFFQDPNDIPVPPEEVRIRQLDADPYPDGRRVRIYLEVTPFQRRPDAEIKIISTDGREVAHASIVETIDPRMEVTLHLRVPDATGLFKVQSVIYYRDLETEKPVESAEVSADESAQPMNTVVDQAEITIEIP